MFNENTIITITTHCYINRHSSEKNVDRFLECQKYYIIIISWGTGMREGIPKLMHHQQGRVLQL